jgi:beta-glucanase (GH16 family)
MYSMHPRILLLWLLSVGVCYADRNWNRPGWAATFGDEFNSTNRAVNTAKWNVDDGPNSANNEAQWYSRDNVWQETGNLVLKSEVRTINGYPFASGKVTTAGKFSPHYGRIEIRAKLPTGKGIWPAHWMLPYGHWPPEIDITEMIGSAPQNMVVSHHQGPLPPGCTYPWECGMTHNTTVWWNVDWSQAFHTYALEWDWWGLKWFIDDVQVFADYSTPPDEPMFLILNTAVGGNWPGYPDGSTPWPQWHLIDHVRMYQRWYGNSLLNGGFEQQEDNAFPNWNTINDTGSNIVPGTAVSAHSGTGAVKMTGAYNGATNSSWLVQDLPAQPGQIWQASVWAANRAGDLLQGRNHARLKLEFLDGSRSFLAHHALTVAASNTPAAYAQFVLRQKAPADAALARIALEFNQFNHAPGSVNCDDAQLYLLTTELPGSERALVNGDFEQGDANQFASWNTYGSDTNILAEPLLEQVYHGLRAVRVAAQPGGSPGSGTGLYQDVPARPGEFWTASVWAQSCPTNPLTGGDAGVLKLEFVDADGNRIQTNEVTVVSQLSPPSYTNAVITQVAPVGAAFARLTVEHRQAAGGGGAADFDLASLSTSTDTSQLINNGLELWDGSNFPGWTTYFSNGNITNDPANARTGTNAARLSGQFPTNSAANESGLYQERTAAAGQLWQATVWAQSTPGQPLRGLNHADLKLEFLDANGAFLDRDEIVCVSSNSAPGYQPFVLRRVAPKWTARARIAMAFFQQNNATGAADFDDAELKQVTANDPRPTLNPGFEDGRGSSVPNWTTWNNVVPNVIHDANTNHARTGTEALEIFGPFNGQSNCGAFQDFPAAPGEMWQGSIWGRSRPGDPLGGGNSVRLKLEFYDTNSTLLGTNLLTILNAASSTNYQPFTIRRTAPSGASRARFTAEFLQANYAGGAVDLDDAQVGLLTAANTNRFLLNAGFETGQGNEFGEWVAYGPGTLQNVSRDPLPGNARSGAQCLQMWGAYNGQNNSSGLYQDIPVAPGETWQASIWARNRPGDALQVSNQALFKLEFVDASGSALLRDQLVAVNAGSPANYQNFVLRGIAPAGAAYARLVVQLDQVGATTGGSVNVDDCTLQLVTAQQEPALLNSSFDYTGVSSIPDWTTYGSAYGGNVRMDPIAANARTGSNALQVFGQNNGAANNSGVYQDMPAVEGQLWQAAVWSRHRPGSPLQGGNYAVLKLEFVSANGAVLARSQQTVLNASVSSTAYRRCAVLRPAPPGTAQARSVLELNQLANAGGSVDFDDASLSPVPTLTGPQGEGVALWGGPLQPQGLVSFTGSWTCDASSLDLQIPLRGASPGSTLGFPQLQIAGSANPAGNLEVLLPTTFEGQRFTPRKDDTFQLLTATSVVGTFGQLLAPPALGGGSAFSLTYQSTGVVLRVVGELDSDGNGLPDYWEQQYFGTPVGASANADSDSDGASNLAEYLAGTDPLNGQSLFRILGVTNDASGMTIRVNSALNRFYTLQYRDSASVGQWSNVAYQTDIPGSGSALLLDDPAPAVQARYYRVSVRP